MFQSEISRSVVTDALLPRMSNVVQSYVSAAAKMINSPVDFSRLGLSLIRSGCLRLPQARMALTGTRCAAPLVQKEAQVVGTVLQCDLLLMRCEGSKGVSLDIYQSHLGRWLSGYQFWERNDETWLIPSQPSMPAFRIAEGLEEHSDQPFANTEAREDGLELADNTFVSFVRGSI